MKATHLEVLVEEPSMEAFLRELLLRLLPGDRSFELHPFQGKSNLMSKLEARLHGYAAWLPTDWRVIVVVDRDDDDCELLKGRLEEIAGNASLRTRSRSRGTELSWQLVNRIAVEELEAWYFGDWAAVCSVYPRLSPTVCRQASYRQPDAIAGGTWEAFERILQRRGYYRGGMAKLEVARALGAAIDPARNTSGSFVCFRDAVLEAVE